MSEKVAPTLAGHLIFWFTVINLACVFHTKAEIDVGPWGSVEEDNKWTYQPTGNINHITVTYTQNAVHSICFTSIDKNGKLDKSKFSCKNATKTAEIDIDVKTEKINGISGTFDTPLKHSKYITSLSFTTTSNTIYGPFGTKMGTAFSFVAKDKSITGFYGSTERKLNGIGVILSTPSTGTTQDYGPWGGPGGHKTYDYTPTGFISHITLRYELGIHSIIFTSQDKNGVTNTSRMIGDVGGWAGAEVAIDVKGGERLTGISGTVGEYIGFLIIKSLKFHTNKGKWYGPYGAEEAGDKTFSYMGKNSYISGFFGHDGSWVDSLGIHVKPLSKV